ncbi:MAG: hypothetical protein CL693_08090 [Cellvibrionaceae bacterium]|nr:hypothetical protein [Cellvibrionaceae bacterium]
MRYNFDRVSLLLVAALLSASSVADIAKTLNATDAWGDRSQLDGESSVFVTNHSGSADAGVISDGSSFSAAPMVQDLNNVLLSKGGTLLQPEFVKGFRHEAANRAFARLTTAKMMQSVDPEAGRAFWTAYHSLEIFNTTVYQYVADLWQIDITPGVLVKVKASTLAVLPTRAHPWLLRTTLARTLEYVKFLESLKEIGPASEYWFLDYMVKQEKLQVDIMALALEGDYDESVLLVKRFLSEHRTMAPFSELGDFSQ